MNNLFAQVTAPMHRSAARTSTRLMFVRDLVLAARIGVYEHEKGAPQRIRVNLEMAVVEDGGPKDDDLAEVVSYADIVAAVRVAAADGHVNLIETLAERIARCCLADRRVRRVRARVEKLDVYADAAGVGIEIERAND